MGNLYYQFIEVTDFGPYVTKLILGMPREVSGQELDIRKFSVYVQVRQDNGEIAKVPKSFLERDQMVPSMGYRTVTGVYPSDKMGNPADKESRFVTLELAYGPIYPCSSALVADFSNIAGHEFFAVCDYTVTLTEALGEGDDRLGGLVFDRCGGGPARRTGKNHAGGASRKARNHGPKLFLQLRSPPDILRMARW